MGILRTISTSYEAQIRRILLKFIAPSMTTTQRDAILTPETGRIIFNSTTGKMNFYDGSAWKVLTST